MQIKYLSLFLFSSLTRSLILLSFSVKHLFNQVTLFYRSMLTTLAFFLPPALTIGTLPSLPLSLHPSLPPSLLLYLPTYHLLTCWRTARVTFTLDFCVLKNPRPVVEKIEKVVNLWLGFLTLRCTENRFTLASFFVFWHSVSRLISDTKFSILLKLFSIIH